MILQIRREREKRNWTLEYVANRIGTKKTTVQMMETGKRKPSFDVLIKLLKLYEIPCYKQVEELFVAAPDTINLSEI